MERYSKVFLLIYSVLQDYPLPASELEAKSKNFKWEATARLSST